MIRLYRDYRDVANSAIKKWGREQYAHIERLVTQDECIHWFCENVNPNIRELMKGFFDAELTDHEASILKWYVRNHWFIEHQFDSRHNQVFLIQYEDAVTNPEEIGRQICVFLGINFHIRLVSHMHRSSISKNAFPEIRPEIKELCDELFQKLTEIAWHPQTKANPEPSQ